MKWVPGRTAAFVAVVAAAVVGVDLWLLTQTGEHVLRLALWLGAAAAAASGAICVAAAASSDGRRPKFGKRAATVVACAALSTVAVGSWIGANSPRVSWFGALVANGARDDPRVALTFDDGPNARTTPAVQAILDERGVKGTFFQVGRAVVDRPDIVRSLIEAGHLVANHSYTHDSLRWLDPRYPELVRTQQAFAREAGMCPAFFRPPHGQHTPAMAFVVHRQSMVMVGWDVSASDWTTEDAGLVARRVLDRVRPGSIVDLHDGLDGRVDADRSVVARALPLILDGLAAKGLRPVRLDELLGRPGYLESCPGR